MKKMIVALLCLAHGTCLPVLTDDGVKDPKKEQITAPRRVNNAQERETRMQELLERQVEAIELIAVSTAMSTCIKLEEYNLKPGQLRSTNKSASPECNAISKRYRDLLEKK